MITASRTSDCTCSHGVNLGVSSPFSKGLPLEPEQDTTQAPYQNQCHICHDRRDIPICNNPWRDELGEAITPDVLVDRDGNEDAACNGLVRINRICGKDCWKRGNLDTSAGPSDYHDDLPVPGMLISQSSDNIPDDHQYYVGNSR